MDRTGIIVVSICAVLLVFGFVEQQKFAQQQMVRQQHFEATNVVATTSSSATTSAVASGTAAIASTQILDASAPENLIVISNADARYTFTSRGGGLKSVELLKYPETISPRWKKEMATNAVATLNSRAPLPILAVLDGTNFTGQGNFTLTKTADGVRAEKTFADGLVLTKEFHASSNYLINATVSLQNRSDKTFSLPAQEWVVGTAMPMGPDDNNFLAYGGAMWFDGTSPQNRSVSYFSTNTTILGIFHRTPTPEYVAGAGNVIWAATHNQFFTLLAMPKQPAQQIVERPVSLPAFTTNGFTAPLKGIQTAFVYPAQTLTANQSVERTIVFYAGPKEYRQLVNIGEEFQNRADLVMNFGTGLSSFFGIGSFCAKALLLAMNWLHDLVPKLSYGWVIVLLTIILRGIFWPLTSASMRSMKKMQALAPQVKALKEKYKDDVQKFFKKQQELYKENHVSQLSGCLPMLIQMPVFLGFFTMIRSAIELRGAHFLWAADLSKPDTLFMIPGLTFIPFISTPDGLPFNLLPILMVTVMIWQAHLTPQSPGMDPSQQKMMRFMPLMMLIFLYNYSSGMALYMTISTLSSVLQTKLTRMKQMPVTNTIPALTPPSKKKK